MLADCGDRANDPVRLGWILRADEALVGDQMKKMLAAAFAAMSFGAPASAAELIINADGKLTGANNVVVEGTSYDVRFVDGSCQSAYGGCDQNSDFTFSNSSQVSNAGMALLEQVFTGRFDDDAELVFGCLSDFGSAGNSCYTIIPYSLNSQFSSIFESIWVYNSPQNDFIQFHDGSVSTSSVGAAANFAVFTRSPISSAVPEPGTWAMMLLGFGAIGATMRRRRTNLFSQMA